MFATFSTSAGSLSSRDYSKSLSNNQVRGMSSSNARDDKGMSSEYDMFRFVNARRFPDYSKPRMKPRVAKSKQKFQARKIAQIR